MLRVLKCVFPPCMLLHRLCKHAVHDKLFSRVLPAACCVIIRCGHAVLCHAMCTQERIKALVEERKKLLEGGSGSEGSSSQQHGGSGECSQIAAAVF